MAMVENSSKRCAIRQFLIAPVILTLVTGLSLTAQAQNERPEFSAGMQGVRGDGHEYHLKSPLEGSWIFNIDLEDLSNQKTTMNSLISFTAGGVVITSASLATPSPFYGSWRQTGPKSFSAVFYAFVPDPITGTLGTLKQNLKLDLTSLNELTGTGVGSTCDLQGDNCTQLNSGQFTGKRILAE